MRKILLLLIGVIMMFSLIACGDKKETIKKTMVKSKQTLVEDVLFKVQDIKEKNKQEVSNLLGKPISTQETEWYFADSGKQAKDCFTSIYNKNSFEIEVFFIEGKAARITITPNNMKYPEDNKKIFKQLGLSTGTPSFENECCSRWQDKFGVSEISINARENKMNFILIILDEKYR